MSISSVLPGSLTAPDWQNVSRQRRQDFNDLATSLQAGDLGGAKTAFSDLQSLITQPDSLLGSSAIQKDFNALGDALNSNNLSAAQNDFSQIKTDINSLVAQGGGSGGAHAHHRHHRVAAAYQDPASSAQNDPASPGLNVVA